MKILPLFESLTHKQSFDGPYKVFKFKDGKDDIGTIFVKLRKGWNQTHIEVNTKYQNKGYAGRMLKIVANSLQYIAINANRVMNPDVWKVIAKLETDNDLEIFSDGDDKIISNKSMTEDNIRKILNYGMS